MVEKSISVIQAVQQRVWLVECSKRKSSILIIERDRTGGFIPPVFVVQS